METRNEVKEIRERFAEDRDVMTQAEHENWLKAVGLVLAGLVVTVALGVILTGCGGKSDSAVAQSQEEHAVATTTGQTQVASAVPAGAQGGARQQGLSATDQAVREGLPPDLSLAVTDTLVTPGQVVDVLVQGTPDVSSVALSDGRDEPMPFVRDAGTNTWRAQYRVPLHPRHERFGVSVTARTDADRWRRVWVFLHVASPDDGGDEEPMDNPDSLGSGK
jgi:hypothetical protein